MMEIAWRLLDTGGSCSVDHKMAVCDEGTGLERTGQLLQTELMRLSSIRGVSGEGKGGAEDTLHS